MQYQSWIIKPRFGLYILHLFLCYYYLYTVTIFYTGDDEDMLGPEGMEKFCEDIGVEPENVSCSL